MSARTKGFIAGVLFANAIPHLASAIGRHPHLTPIGGKDSGPRTNLLWSLGNLAAAGLLVRRQSTSRWDGQLLAVEAGAVAWSAWMLGSERVLRVNHGQPETRSAT